MRYSALIGKPVEHSVSPSMFKYIANEKNIEYEHLKIEIENRDNLKECLEAFKKLGFCGLNVTMPYKIDVVKYMDILDESAKHINSVNTIKIVNNKYIGYNTDGIAAVKSIEKNLCKIDNNTKVLIIGAGGAARPICYEIHKKTQNIVVMNRNKEEALDMINCINKNIPVYELSKENYVKQINEADLIINATPIGMSPNDDERLYRNDVLKCVDRLEEKYFFDVIFNPYKTNFLLDAEIYGAKTCSGLYMMIYQILLAFKIWTDINVDEIDVEDAKNEILKNGYKFGGEK